MPGACPGGVGGHQWWGGKSPGAARRGGAGGWWPAGSGQCQCLSGFLITKEALSIMLFKCKQSRGNVYEGGDVFLLFMGKHIALNPFLLVDLSKSYCF